MTLPGDSLSFILCSVAPLYPTFCDPMHYWGPPGSSVHGISQAKLLEWVAISFSRGSFPPRDQTTSPALAGGFFNTWTREVQGWLEIGISALLPSCFGSFTSNCVPMKLWSFRTAAFIGRRQLQWHCNYAINTRCHCTM